MYTTGMLPFFCIMTAAGLALLIPGIIKTFTHEHNQHNYAAAFLCFACPLLHAGGACIILELTRGSTMQIFGTSMDLGFVILAVIALIMLGLLIADGILHFHHNFIVYLLFAFLTNVGAIIQGRAVL